MLLFVVPVILLIVLLGYAKQLENQGTEEPLETEESKMPETAESLPEELKATAMTNEGEVMAVEHRKYPIYGVQFHPESVMTPQGAKMIENFLLAGEKRPLGWK